jgi:hypothetical protein
MMRGLGWRVFMAGLFIAFSFSLAQAYVTNPAADGQPSDGQWRQ